MLNNNYLQNNTYFVDNIKEIYPKTGNQWLLDLPNQLKKLAEDWNFEFDSVMPELSYSFVARVDFHDKKAIIKIAPPEQSLAKEILCLSCFQKDSPQIFHFDENLNAVLMEYIYPGKSLKDLVRNGQDDRATQIISKVIRELRFQTLPTKHSFKHMSELAKDLDILHGHFDKNLLDKAIRLFNEMTIDCSNDIVLHGDLHHDNILSSNDDWKIIDPHGYIGDPVAEVGAMIRNPYDCFPDNKPLEKILTRRLSILNDELPYAFDRIKAWCYCISVLSVAWTYADFKKVTPSDVELIYSLNRVCF